MALLFSALILFRIDFIVLFHIPFFFILMQGVFKFRVISSLAFLVKKGTSYQLLEEELFLHKKPSGGEVFQVDGEPESQGELQLILLNRAGSLDSLNFIDDHLRIALEARL